MAREGYDVWFGNNRGTKYTENTIYEWDSREYWDFTVYDMSMHDVPAMNKLVWDVTGGRKMSMLSFSQGTTVLQYSMAEMPEFHEKYTNVVGLVAPCGVMDVRQTETIFNEDYYNFLNDNNVLGINGPGWEEDNIKICEYS
jgi:lysosomal acid lipase/cholesteryl ester hydrolase